MSDLQPRRQTPRLAPLLRNEFECYRSRWARRLTVGLGRGAQNDCSENRRSDGACVVPAGNVRPGGPGPAGISFAWHCTIDSARCRGPGEAGSRLQAAEGSCPEAHATARPQHRPRASAARVETADRLGRHPSGFPSSFSTRRRRGWSGSTGSSTICRPRRPASPKAVRCHPARSRD